MARKKASLMHGSAKGRPVIWHREHRSKKGRTQAWNLRRLVAHFKRKKAKLLDKELTLEAREALNG